MLSRNFSTEFWLFVIYPDLVKNCSSLLAGLGTWRLSAMHTIKRWFSGSILSSVLIYLFKILSVTVILLTPMLMLLEILRHSSRRYLSEDCLWRGWNYLINLLFTITVQASGNKFMKLATASFLSFNLMHLSSMLGMLDFFPFFSFCSGPYS